MIFTTAKWLALFYAILWAWVAPLPRLLLGGDHQLVLVIASIVWLDGASRFLRRCARGQA